MNVLIVGATGLVGSHLLRLLLAHNEVQEVNIVVRRPISREGLTNLDKLTEQIHPLDTLPTIAFPEGPFQLFICLGTTIKEAGSQPAFRWVDYELPLHFATKAAEAGVNAIHLVSALGANPDSGIFYSRTKGEIERDIAALKVPSFHIYQPSLLLGKRAKPRLGETIMGALSFLTIGPLRQYRPIRAEKVASYMVQMMERSLAHGKSGTQIHPSIEMNNH